MEEKLYTMGQIGKRFKVNLKEVSIWRKKLIEAKLIQGGRSVGVERIPGDKHYRFGIPESIVKHFPNLPPQA